MSESELNPTTPMSAAAAALTRASISRRQFLTGSAAISLGAVLMGHDHQITQLLSDLGGPSAGAAEVTEATLVPPPVPNFTFSIDREEDLALLDFAFYGFTAVTSGNVLERRVTGLQASTTNSIITVQFPPQAIGEAAYNFPVAAPGTTQKPWYVDPPPVLSAMSGPSRLCFTVPNATVIPLPTMTASDLLDWSQWILLVPASATVSVPAKTQYPLTADKPLPPNPDPTLSDSLPDLLTYIEYPYALCLAPTVYQVQPGVPGSHPGAFRTTFNGRPMPLESPRKFYDCWTAALSQTDANGNALVAQGAAVWEARDFKWLAGQPGDATKETAIDYSKD